ncbi:apoptosis-inducing factor 3-like isoform X1 [Palaemon carinicauda]|uniref:apoptosis-inducing factor 3-like isoform X1 n=2 Tax=Palaemon carinicauda TaxID=392227 RepID=UPI0035B672CE
MAFLLRRVVSRGATGRTVSINRGGILSSVIESLSGSYRRNTLSWCHLARTRVTLRKMGATASCGNGGGNDSDYGDVIEDRRMSSASNANDMVEAVVCHQNDLPEEGMKSFDIEGGKVLLVNQKGFLSAVGSKCSHYGAPLEKGVLCEGRIRCPWHGACFDAVTGDIEDYPGLDSLPKYEVSIEEDGNVKVRASKALLTADKRIKTMAKRDPENESVFLIIGGGAAGASCVEKLRQEGFTGRVILVSQENVLPYDRPKLSKAMDLTADKISLRTQQFYESADIELRLGTGAVSIDTVASKVHLSNNEEITFDKLFIATGGKPRRLTVPGGYLSGVFVVRAPEDANSVAADAAGKNVVVVGSSFIGMEVASYLSSDNRAESVTVIGNTSVPFENSLGVEVGSRIRQMFEEQGVKFLNAGVMEIVGDGGKLTGVLLDNEEKIEADIVVTGIGVVPETDFLSGSSIERNENGYVEVNEFLETSVPNIYCGGDIALFPLFLHDGARVAIGHWQVALGHGAYAARNMMGQGVPVRSVPFFWSVLYGKSLRYTGHGRYDEVLISGSLDNLSFIAYYINDDRVVALASLGKDPAAAKYAESLNKGEFLTKSQVLEDGDIALKL